MKIFVLFPAIHEWSEIPTSSRCLSWFYFLLATYCLTITLCGKHLVPSVLLNKLENRNGENRKIFMISLKGQICSLLGSWNTGGIFWHGDFIHFSWRCCFLIRPDVHCILHVSKSTCQQDSFWYQQQEVWNTPKEWRLGKPDTEERQ